MCRPSTFTRPLQWSISSIASKKHSNLAIHSMQNACVHPNSGSPQISSKKIKRWLEKLIFNIESSPQNVSNTPKFFNKIQCTNRNNLSKQKNPISHRIVYQSAPGCLILPATDVALQLGTIWCTLTLARPPGRWFLSPTTVVVVS